jgi:hypothetical protein
MVRELAHRLILRNEPGLTDEELSALDAGLASLRDPNDRSRAVDDLFFLSAALEDEGFLELATQLFVIASRRARGRRDAVHRSRAIDRAEIAAAKGQRFASFTRTPTPRPSSTSNLRALRVRDFGGRLIV